MTKEELLKALRESAENVKKAEDTVANIETKVVDAPVAKADGVEGLDSELPTQKDVEKAVDAACDPLVPADKDGVSKNGGEDDRMEAGKVEAERKHEDNAAKDVINVSTRKVEEAAEVNEELLKQLREAAEREEAYKEKIAKSIERLAKNTAREVAKTKIPVALDNMTSYERRLVHNILTDFKGVKTESEGEEPNRHVVIKPE